MPSNDILRELDARGLLGICTNRRTLAERLGRGPICGYCGFDPTADSLHVGSLLSLAALRLWLVRGHDAVALVGGFTGMIGDPSGKSQERNLLDIGVLDQNRAALTEQIGRLLTVDGRTPRIVDNRTWFEGMTGLELLRDIGKLMPVKDMLERDSVKARLAAGGLSFTEFAYQLLQAYDFVYLRETINCELQLGGTDQYGNITAGTDMIRRRGLGAAWGLVWPLLTKADGSKFGKTESGAVWLSAERTSTFAFHQYWLATPDAEVGGLLAKFTLLSIDEIDEILSRHERDRGARVAQRSLADAVTTWVHGADATASANRAAAALFGGRLDADELKQVIGAIPTVRLPRHELRVLPVAQAACRAGLCATLSDARRLINDGGLYIRGERVSDANAVPDTAEPYVVLRRGARTHALIVLDGD